MPKLKKGKWTPEEVSKLRSIGKTADSKHITKLRKLAESWERDYSNLYAKWQYEHAHNVKEEDETDMIVFEIDTTITEPTRFNMDELRRLQRGLDDAIPKLGVRNGNIPIANKLVGQTRKYLDSTYPKNKFIFSVCKKDGEPTGFTRVFKIQ